jgi:formyl-CoA transferase
LSPPADGAGVSGPLAGLKVLELASLYAAPLVAAMLGDLGADVVKVEPVEGEPFRAIAARARGPSVWTLVSRNKRMVVADHRQPDGLELLRRLTAAADVVVANHQRFLLERMDCTYEAVSARNPAVVMVNVSGWGDDGPYADRGGNGTVAEAFAGLTDVVAAGEDRPLSPALLGDCLTALSGAVGVLAACVWRAATSGRGQYVEVPMYEAVLRAVAPQIVAAGTGERAGAGLRQVVATADGCRVVATAYTIAQIERLLDAVGVARPDDADGPPTDAATLGGLVEDWAGRHDLATVMAALEATRIPAAPVNDVEAVMADPHVQARSAITAVDVPGYGTVRMPAPTPRLSATPGIAARFAERPLGADTAEVSRDWLGIGAG